MADTHGLQRLRDRHRASLPRHEHPARLRLRAAPPGGRSLYPLHPSSAQPADVGPHRRTLRRARRSRLLRRFPTRPGDDQQGRIVPLRGNVARLSLVSDTPARAAAACARGPGPAFQPAPPKPRAITAMKAQESMNSPRRFPWLAWGLIALLLGSTHGCGGGSPEGGTTPASTASKTKSESEKPRIALIMKSLANELFKTMAKGARKHQGEHSSEYELMVNGIKDERDLKRQVDLVEEMVAQRVDAIVIAPADSKALVSACKHAQEAGIAVVHYRDQKHGQEPPGGQHRGPTHCFGNQA